MTDSKQTSGLSKPQKWLMGGIGLTILTFVAVLALGYAATDNLFSRQQQVPEEDVLVPDAIMAGRNHNNAANAYAYDVTEIRQYLTGEKEYTGEKLVFLTIDDGANFDITPGVLDVLRDHGVPATFFPIGSYVTEEHAPLYQRQIKEGHAIGLHSVSHDMGLLYPGGVPNPEQITHEAKEAENYLKSILGLKFDTRVWRYPGGHMSWQGLETADQGLRDIGLDWIDWNANVGDGEPDHKRPRNVEEIIQFHATSHEAFGETPENLRVVLMHDTWGKNITLESLPHIIQYYKDQGFTFGVLY